MKRAKALPASLQRELSALRNFPDKDSDISDIPEITDAEWLRRKVGPIYRPVKKSISLRLDADILEWFRGKGQGYQTAMNRALREYMTARR